MSVSSLPQAAVGTLLPERRYLIDQQLIARYAQVSGDFNPLHLDPEFAATTPFGRIIAHGMMAMAFVSQAMRDWAGPAWEEAGDLSVTFVAPVYLDDEVTVRIAVEEADAESVRCSVQCLVGDRLTLKGEASVGECARE